MNKNGYKERVKQLMDDHKALIERPNERAKDTNGIVQRYQYPVLTAAHTPVFWRYDLDPAANPLLCERMGINSTFNVGAIELDGRSRSQIVFCRRREQHRHRPISILGLPRRDAAGGPGGDQCLRHAFNQTR